MKYTIVIDQVHAKEWRLNATEAIVFCFCYSLPSWADRVTIEGVDYYFGSRNKCIEEMPILSAKPDTIYRTYKKLKEKGLIHWTKVEGKDCIALTEVAKQWNSTPENSDLNPRLGKKSENNSDLNPTNKYTNNNKREDALKNSISYLSDPAARAEVQSQFPRLNADKEMDAAADWLRANGKRKKDYAAFVRNWMRRAEKDLPTTPADRIPLRQASAPIERVSAEEAAKIRQKIKSA